MSIYQCNQCVEGKDFDPIAACEQCQDRTIDTRKTDRNNADYEWSCIECGETQYEKVVIPDPGDLRCQSCGAHYNTIT